MFPVTISIIIVNSGPLRSQHSMSHYSLNKAQTCKHELTSSFKQAKSLERKWLLKRKEQMEGAGLKTCLTLPHIKQT